MKKILFLIAIVASHTCTAQLKADSIRYDSLPTYFGDNLVCKNCGDLIWHDDMPQPGIISIFDSTAFYKKECDSLRYVIIAKNFRLNRIKFYWNLYRKHPAYLKFLNSWISRAEN
jgi:hypothetical protein